MAKKKENMLGVIFDNIEDSPAIDSDNSNFYIPFYKRDDYFEVYENKVLFIKECEKLVRKHKFYKTYIKYLVDIVGMNTCQVLPGIECSEGGKKGKVTLEMHHGPILTLFDTCHIILNCLIKDGCEDITTFKVADIVIEEHRLNNVRVILLSKSVHQQVHEDNIMLNYHMGFGDTKTFLSKYNRGLTKSLKNGINEYIQWSLENDSFDNNVLELSDSMRQWGNNDFDSFYMEDFQLQTT